MHIHPTLDIVITIPTTSRQTAIRCVFPWILFGTFVVLMSGTREKGKSNSWMPTQSLDKIPKGAYKLRNCERSGKLTYKGIKINLK